MNAINSLFTRFLKVHGKCHWIIKTGVIHEPFILSYVHFFRSN